MTEPPDVPQRVLHRLPRLDLPEPPDGGDRALLLSSGRRDNPLPEESHVEIGIDRQSAVERRFRLDRLAFEKITTAQAEERERPAVVEARDAIVVDEDCKSFGAAPKRQIGGAKPE